MPFLRSLATFILSFLFATSILMAITSYNIGNLIQKESIKNFIKSESLKYVSQQCENQCDQYPEYKELCVQRCLAETTNQTEVGVNKAVDDIYQQKLLDMVSLDEASSLLSQYLLFLVIGVICGVLIFFASKAPFKTLGKDFISISISLFISSIIPQFIIASVNLPFDLGQAIKDYLSPSFSQLMSYGIAFLVAGIVLIIINYLLERRKETKEKRKVENKRKK